MEPASDPTNSASNPPQPEPVSVAAAPVVPPPEPAAEVTPTVQSNDWTAAAEALLKAPEKVEKPPSINLLGHQPPPPVHAGQSSPADNHHLSDKLPHHRQLWPVLVATMLVTGITGASAYYLVFGNSNKPSPTPPPPPAASEPAALPAPPPPPTPPPPPPPSPTADTVTAPQVAPTLENPQTVTIKAENGLWLRRTPDSSNRNNIIAWMPNGAQISVDQVGDFWWHGTYKGQAGYFASNYTK